MYTENDQFWRRKTLAQMSAPEWESLCDGCGRCCMVKLEDEDTGELHQTRLACQLLDCGTCRCRNYGNRHATVPDCVVLNAQNITALKWMPPTCAYRLVDEGKDLFWWHPLVSGDANTVHEAGVSVRGFARSETGIEEGNYWRFIVKP